MLHYSSQAKRTNQKFDLMHYHLDAKGKLRGTWKEAVTGYRKIMQDSNHIYWLTILREPREHLLSYYSYYFEPVLKVSEIDTNAT